MDKADAGPCRIFDAAYDGQLSADRDRSLVRLINAAENLHQSGLPCTILADERKHFAGICDKADVLERLHPGKAFGDPRHFECRFGHCYAPPMSFVWLTRYASMLSFLMAWVGMIISLLAGIPLLSPFASWASILMDWYPNWYGCWTTAP